MSKPDQAQPPEPEQTSIERPAPTERPPHPWYERPPVAFDLPEHTDVFTIGAAKP